MELATYEEYGAMDPFGNDVLLMPPDAAVGVAPFAIADDDESAAFFAATSAGCVVPMSSPSSAASGESPLTLSPCSSDVPSPAQLPPSTKPPKQKRRKAESPSAPAPAAAATSGVVLTGEERAGQLPREVVAKLTSPDVQRYMAEARARRPLSDEEQLQLKKLRRLVKNRESAQHSRQRKRDYVDKLEGIIRGMGATESALRAENSALRDYAGALQAKLSAAGLPFPPMPPQTPNNDPSDVDEEEHSPAETVVQLPLPQQQLQQQQQQQRLPTRPLKAAGVCFLVVLFSVGLFFNAAQQQRVSQQTFAPADGRVLAEQQQKLAAVTQEQQQQQQAPRGLMGLAVEDFVDEPTTTTTIIDDNSAALVAHAATPSLRLPFDGVVKPLGFGEWTPRNISYLFCNNVKRYDPPQLDGSGLLSFMVPLASLNGSSIDGVVDASADDGDLVEVTCSVVDVNIVPSHIPSSR